MRCRCPGCTLAAASGDRGYAPLGHGSLADAFLHLDALERRTDGGCPFPFPGTDTYDANADVLSNDGYRMEVLGIASILGGV